MSETKILNVKSGTGVRELAGSIIKSYENGEKNIELRAIGAASVNQMYKAVTTARSIFAQRGLDLLIKPGFDETEINGDKRTVIVARLVIE